MTRDDNLDADFGRSAEPGQDIEAHAAAGNNTQWPPLEASYGTGRQPIIDTLAADLAVIEPDLSVNQVKEKFGGLRVYVSATPAHHDAVYARIEQTEQDAERTCERCGQPGQLNDDLHWVLTLCDACSDLRAAERAAQWRWARPGGDAEATSPAGRSAPGALTAQSPLQLGARLSYCF